MSETMTKTEREDLKRLARERARVAKADAARRTADLKAMFEQQMMDSYSFDDEDVWKEALAAIAETVEEANVKIKARADELGIPHQFTPRVSFQWEKRDPRWEIRAEQDGLRRAAYKRIEAMERTAKHEIDRAALDVQTKLVEAGLTSGAAVAFLNSMPSVEALMPALDIHQLTAGTPPSREHGDDIEF